MLARQLVAVAVTVGVLSSSNTGEAGFHSVAITVALAFNYVLTVLNRLSNIQQDINSEVHSIATKRRYRLLT